MHSTSTNYQIWCNITHSTTMTTCGRTEAFRSGTPIHWKIHSSHIPVCRWNSGHSSWVIGQGIRRCMPRSAGQTHKIEQIYQVWSQSDKWFTHKWAKPTRGQKTVQIQIHKYDRNLSRSRKSHVEWTLKSIKSCNFIPSIIFKLAHPVKISHRVKIKHLCVISIWHELRTNLTKLSDLNLYGRHNECIN